MFGLKLNTYESIPTHLKLRLAAATQNFEWLRI